MRATGPRRCAPPHERAQPRPARRCGVRGGERRSGRRRTPGAATGRRPPHRVRALPTCARRARASAGGGACARFGAQRRAASGSTPFDRRARRGGRALERPAAPIRGARRIPARRREEEFKRVFAQYLDPANRLLAEIAIGKHRLLVWELRAAGATPAPLAALYFVEVEGKYLLDDVPGETRALLRRLLGEMRAGRLRP
ncbi:MAG: hypothetical protein RML56_12930 [Burkholderiales bacterium]|nr:hypothetical protein [Burkholderiales bacterium]